MISRRAELTDRLSRLSVEPPEGAHCLPLNVAGVRLDFITCSEALKDRVSEYFKNYTGTGPADCQVRAEPLLGDFWEDPDAEFEVKGDWVVQRDFAAKKNPSGTSAVALVAPDLDDAFHNLLRWFLPPILLRAGAFLLHGAGVVRDGRGYVFFGHSEAGKSTSVSLISSSDPKSLALGDDSIIVAMKGNQPLIYSAPLGCGYSRLAPPPECAPLAGLFALTQDQHDQIEILPHSLGVTLLLASTMSVCFDDEVEAKVELATRFALSDCSIKRLRFKRTPAFWPLVRKQTTEETPHVQI